MASKYPKSLVLEYTSSSSEDSEGREQPVKMTVKLAGLEKTLKKISEQNEELLQAFREQKEELREQKVERRDHNHRLLESLREQKGSFASRTANC